MTRQKLRDYVDEQRALNNIPYHVYSALIDGIDTLEQESQIFKWCTGCREYDQEKHCCPRWSKVIRDTVAEMKQEYIEREVLDKIRAEIKEWYWQADKQALAKDPCVVDAMIDLFIRTIDKYKAEPEDKE